MKQSLSFCIKVVCSIHFGSNFSPKTWYFDNETPLIDAALGKENIPFGMMDASLASQDKFD